MAYGIWHIEERLGSVVIFAIRSRLANTSLTPMPAVGANKREYDRIVRRPVQQQALFENNLAHRA